MVDSFSDFSDVVDSFSDFSDVVDSYSDFWVVQYNDTRHFLTLLKNTSLFMQLSTL